MSCKGITTPSVGRSGKQRVKWQWQVLIVLYLPLPCCLEMGVGGQFWSVTIYTMFKSDAPLDARCSYSLNVYYILHKDLKRPFNSDLFTFISTSSFLEKLDCIHKKCMKSSEENYLGKYNFSLSRESTVFAASVLTLI